MKRSARWLNLPLLPAWYRGELWVVIQFGMLQRCPAYGFQTFKAVRRVTSSFVGLKCLGPKSLHVPHIVFCLITANHSSVLTITMFYRGCKLSCFLRLFVPLMLVQFIKTKVQLWHSISTQDSLIGYHNKTLTGTQIRTILIQILARTTPDNLRSSRSFLFCCSDWRQPFTWWCLEANRIIYFLFERLEWNKA